MCQPQAKLSIRVSNYWGQSTPQSSGEGRSRETWSTLPQQCPPWYTALLILLHKGCFGRRNSIHGSSFLGEKVLSSLIYACQITVRSYSRMVKRSNVATSLSVIWFDPEESLQNVAVTSSNALQVSHADFFSKWRNCVTFCIGMKHWQSMGSAGANRCIDFTNRYISEILACPKYVICYKGEEVGMGYLEGIWGRNCNILYTFFRTKSDNR